MILGPEGLEQVECLVRIFSLVSDDLLLKGQEVFNEFDHFGAELGVHFRAFSGIGLPCKGLGRVHAFCNDCSALSFVDQFQVVIFLG